MNNPSGVFSFLLSLILAASASAPLKASGQYEAAADLHAPDVLPPELQSGDAFTVADRVRSDGHRNHYVIHTRFGDFDAVGAAMLRVREHEAGALAAIDELSKSEVFIDAAADAGRDQIEVIQSVATKPVETLKGIPDGVGRMFKRYRHQASDVYSDTKESITGDDSPESEDYTESAIALTERYFKVSAAEREWAQKLGTDPYTSNQTLTKAIKNVAWVDRLGHMAVTYSGLTIPYSGTIARINSVVWGKDPAELAEYNRKRLASMGAGRALIDDFLDNPYFSPTRQTALTEALAELDGVEERDGIIRQATRLDRLDHADYFLQTVAMQAWYHQKRQRLVSVNTHMTVPVGVLADGTAVLTFPSDHLYWTESMARAAAEFRVLASDHPNRKPEFLVLGSTSEHAREGLQELGFLVETELWREIK